MLLSYHATEQFTILFHVWYVTLYRIDTERKGMYVAVTLTENENHMTEGCSHGFGEVNKEVGRACLRQSC